MPAPMSSSTGGSRPASAVAPLKGAYYVLATLTLVNVLSNIDRSLPAILIEAIRHDIAMTDFQFGLLNGLLFTTIYCTFSFPMAKYSDRHDRRALISTCLLVWSLATAASAGAANFLHLLLGRSGVAIGEAGAIPASQSIISDYFPPARRGFALSVLMSGSAVGTMLGMVVGGWLSDAVGWRAALVLVGMIGLIWAAVTRFTVAEPRRTATAPSGSARRQAPTLLETFRHLGRRAAFRHLAAGAALYAVFSSALGAFTPSYLIRTYGVTTAQAGLYFGVVFGLAGGAGAVIGGILSDRLGRRDERWNLWVPAIGLSVAAPAAFLAFYVSSLQACLLFLIVPKLLGPLFLGTCYAVMYRMVGAHMRAVSSAVLLLIIQGIGAALGPVVAGFMSDWLRPTVGPASIKVALMAISLVLAWGALHFFMASRSLADAVLPEGEE